MSAPITIARNELRQRFRDRSVIVLGFIAPVVIATLMSFAFSSSATFDIKLGVVQADHGSTAAALMAGLRSSDLRDLVAVRSFPTTAAARKAVDSGAVDAALVIPFDFSADVLAGRSVDLGVLTSRDKQLAGEVTRSIASGFVQRINAIRLSVTTALSLGSPASSVAALTSQAAASVTPEQLVDHPTGARPLEGVSYYGPSMAIFFLLFAVGFGARGYFVEQRTGTLERMSAAVRPSAIVIGKALAVAVYGSASLATMVFVTTFAFGADWGGPLPATTVCAAMVIAVVSLTGLVTVAARTERQAEGLASIVVFGLALLGGNFTFTPAAPSIVRRLALLTPNGWALRAFVDLATGPHSMGVVVGPVAAMLAFSAVVTGLAWLLSLRTGAT